MHRHQQSYNEQCQCMDHSTDYAELGVALKKSVSVRCIDLLPHQEVVGA